MRAGSWAKAGNRLVSGPAEYTPKGGRPPRVQDPGRMQSGSWAEVAEDFHVGGDFFVVRDARNLVQGDRVLDQVGPGAGLLAVFGLADPQKTQNSGVLLGPRGQLDEF